jgi:hypothetical protein
MEKMKKFSRQVKWWQNNFMFPLRRLWLSIATRFGIRKTGNSIQQMFLFLIL